MDVCKSCLDSSTVDITQFCPNKRDGTIRYDNCLVRYSDINFFTQLDTSDIRSICNGNSVSDPLTFNSQLGDLMSNISSRATSSPSKFATDSIRFNNFNTLYGMVQCTQDLSPTSCSYCSQTMINKIPNQCGRRIGGQVITKSCAIRFESVPFYQLILPPLPLPPGQEGYLPPRPSPGVTGNGKISIVAIVVPIIIGVLLVVAFFGYFLMNNRKMIPRASIIDGGGITSEESLQFDLSKIKTATNDFSYANKLGEGGFGAVYKGRLPDGQEIAVKRLASNSGQGSQEFKNEVVLLHKLQHRNLIRLSGFCLEGEEKLLIYEYVPNRSLDKYLFDPTRKRILSWETRYKIIEGIARGLLYLHEDSRLRIIHRDLKAGNILLDGEMNAKIADFGLAKLFEVDQTQGNTSRIAGTFGYMAPEYALHGLFSVKSDVYSFGVLILEIVTGQKITSFYQSASCQDLLSYAWKHWREGKGL